MFVLKPKDLNTCPPTSKNEQPELTEMKNCPKNQITTKKTKQNPQDQNEPLLTESRNRFVLFPIQNHQV